MITTTINMPSEVCLATWSGPRLTHSSRMLCCPDFVAYACSLKTGHRPEKYPGDSQETVTQGGYLRVKEGTQSTGKRLSARAPPDVGWRPREGPFSGFPAESSRSAQVSTSLGELQVCESSEGPGVFVSQCWCKHSSPVLRGQNM